MTKISSKILTGIFCLIQFFSAHGLFAQSCWSPLGTGVSGSINAMTSFNGHLIAAGTFTSAGGNSAVNIASWNDTAWSPLGSGFTIDPSTSTSVYLSSLAVYSGLLYAAGQFDTAGGVPVHNIAQWDGMSWSAVGTGIPGNSFTVKTLAVYNGALYAGGRFDSIGSLAANNIAKWDGTQWSAVDSGFINPGVVYALATDNGMLYAGGSFSNSGSVDVANVASWNGLVWSPLDSGIALGNFTNEVTSLAIYKGNLYAGVAVLGSPHADSLVEWDGTSWTNISGVSATNFNVGINTLLQFDSVLIIGGGFDSIGGIAANNLALWNGTAYTPFGGGVHGSASPQVNAMVTYNGYLYAGGDFTNADSTNAQSIAEYNCIVSGISDIPASHQVRLYPNPTTGLITISGPDLQSGSSIAVYDLLGEKIYQSNITAEQSTINMKGRPAGAYLYQITDGSGAHITAGKIILQ